MQQRRKTPLLLHIEFSFEVEHAGYALKPILQGIGREFWKGAFGKRSIKLVIMTEESSRELVARLRLDDITSIADFSCHIAPIGAICKHGGISTLHSALDKAWKAVGERRHPDYRGQRERLNPHLETVAGNRDFGAVRERKQRG